MQHVAEAVVVEIRRGDPHPVHLDFEAGRRRHVGESCRCRHSGTGANRTVPAAAARATRAVHEQDVLPAVVVVVEERAPGAERLGQVLLAERAVCA